MEDIDVQYVVQVIEKLKADSFTGSVEINFRCGGISNMNETKSTLRKDFVVIKI